MNHPDDLTLQALHDGELDPAAAAELASHAAVCATCAGRLTALRALSGVTDRWADAVPPLPDDFADQLLARLEAPAASPAPVSAPAPSPISARAPAKVIPLRRWAWPAMAAAAAGVIALGVAIPKGPRGNAVTASQEPVRVGDGNGGVKVTRVDVPGAQSFTVMQLPGVRPDSLTAVVWIQDREESGGSQ